MEESWNKDNYAKRVESNVKKVTGFIDKFNEDSDEDDLLGWQLD